MFKWLTIALLGEFSFITLSPILTWMNSSEAENKGDFRVASAWIQSSFLFILSEEFCCVSFAENLLLLFRVSSIKFLGRWATTNFIWCCGNFIRSYLTNWKQYISWAYSITYELQTDTQSICWGVPQGSVLEPLIFLLYVTDFLNSSTLEPLMFADDANLFFEQ